MPGVVVVVTLASVTLTLPAVATVNEKNVESPRLCSFPSNSSELGPAGRVGAVVEESRRRTPLRRARAQERSDV